MAFLDECFSIGYGWSIWAIGGEVVFFFPFKLACSEVNYIKIAFEILKIDCVIKNEWIGGGSSPFSCSSKGDRPSSFESTNITGVY